jgi:hypothetical protein
VDGGKIHTLEDEHLDQFRLSKHFLIVSVKFCKKSGSRRRAVAANKIWSKCQTRFARHPLHPVNPVLAQHPMIPAGPRISRQTSQLRTSWSSAMISDGRGGRRVSR